MTARQGRLLAVTIGTVSIALVVVSLVLIAMGAAAGERSGTAGGFARTLALFGAPVVGMLIAGRRPSNRFGWLLLSFGFFAAFVTAGGFAAEYSNAVRGARGPTLPLAMIEWALWPAIPLHIPLLLLLFPDGRLPSRAWRWLAGTVVALGVILLTLGPWMPGELAASGLENPYAAPGVWGDVLEVGLFVVIIALFATNLPAAASLWMRRRRAAGQLRMQLRWFSWAASVFAGVLVMGVTPVFDRSPVLNDVLISTSVTFLFTAIGVAVLRYRLYEIDRIISRTVTYAAVTLVVVGVYVGGITVLTTATASRAGSSPVAVAAATLAAAAAFGPARRRIQAVVDRRFNRARYDAARTADAYRARLRDQLDLESIAGDLVATTATAVQPSGAVLWLRPRTGART